MVRSLSSILCVFLVFYALGTAHGETSPSPETNGTKKLGVVTETPKTSTVAAGGFLGGVAFDEVVVQSNLNIKEKTKKNSKSKSEKS